MQSASETARPSTAGSASPSARNQRSAATSQPSVSSETSSSSSGMSTSRSSRAFTHRVTLGRIVELELGEVSSDPNNRVDAPASRLRQRSPLRSREPPGPPPTDEG